MHVRKYVFTKYLDIQGSMAKKCWVNERVRKTFSKCPCRQKVRQKSVSKTFSKCPCRQKGWQKSVSVKKNSQMSVSAKRKKTEVNLVMIWPPPYCLMFHWRSLRTINGGEKCKTKSKNIFCALYKILRN